MTRLLALIVLLSSFSFALAGEEKIIAKRRDASTEEDLRKELQRVPDAGFDQSGAKFAHALVAKSPATRPDVGRQLLTQFAVQNKRPDWVSLPFRSGADCQMGKDPAERLHVFSTNLRLCMQRSVPRQDVRPEISSLRKMLEDGISGKGAAGAARLAWDKPEAVPTICQMLQAENADTRTLMIEMLAKINGKDASIALAQRAIFDLSSDIRERAVQALATRPKDDFKQVVLEAFRWPWQPVADHAAETAVALKWKELVPEMVDLLKEPDPRLPFTKDGPKGDKATYVREMVKVNHLCNCILCHAPSSARDDLVRGLVPEPGREISPMYYGAPSGTFIRADITFLRQDFSVVQPVATPVKWPSFQRFDYMLRTRKANPEEMKLLQGVRKGPADQYPQREALLFGLRELTGTDRGSRTEDWLELQKAIRSKE